MAHRACQNCGAAVTARFARVFGDSDQRAHACKQCSTMKKIQKGAAAGPDEDGTLWVSAAPGEGRRPAHVSRNERLPDLDREPVAIDDVEDDPAPSASGDVPEIQQTDQRFAKLLD